MSGLFLRTSLVGVGCVWSGIGPRLGHIRGHSFDDANVCLTATRLPYAEKYEESHRSTSGKA